MLLAFCNVKSNINAQSDCVINYELSVDDNNNLMLNTTINDVNCDVFDYNVEVEFLFEIHYIDGLVQMLSIPITWLSESPDLSWHVEGLVSTYNINNCHFSSTIEYINISYISNSNVAVGSTDLNFFWDENISLEPNQATPYCLLKLHPYGLGTTTPCNDPLDSGILNNDPIELCPPLSVELIEVINCDNYNFPHYAYPVIYGGILPYENNYTYTWTVNGVNVSNMEISSGTITYPNIVDANIYPNSAIQLTITDVFGNSTSSDLFVFTNDPIISALDNGSLLISDFLTFECTTINNGNGGCYSAIPVNTDLFDVYMVNPNDYYFTFELSSGGSWTSGDFEDGFLQVPSGGFELTLNNATTNCGNSQGFFINDLACELDYPELELSCNGSAIEISISQNWLDSNTNATSFDWEYQALDATEYEALSTTASSHNVLITDGSTNNSGIYRVTPVGIDEEFCSQTQPLLIPSLLLQTGPDPVCSVSAEIIPPSGYSLDGIVDPSSIATLSTGVEATPQNASQFNDVDISGYYLFDIYGPDNEFNFSIPINIGGSTLECEISSQDYTIEPLAFTSVPPITGDQVWDEPMYVAGIVEIEEGASLTILDKVEFFDKNSGIDVLKGGSLVIEGNQAELSGSSISTCGMSVWRGIQLYGIGNDFDEMASVEVRDGATIRNALKAIRSAGTPFLNTGGGKIKLENANFFNNQIAVEMLNQGYDYTNTGAEHSYIRNCNFENTEAFLNAPLYDFYGVTEEFYTHVILDGVRDMPPISGNTFKTSYSAGLSEEAKGSAIVLYDAGVDIGLEESYCNCDDNIFTNLFKGIDAYSLGDISSNVHIWNNEFFDNTKGISINSSTYLTIKDNNFRVPAGAPSPLDSYGIWMESSNTYELMNNSFLTEVTDNLHTRALILHSSSLEPVVVGNYFDGNFTEGTVFKEANPDLRLNCNGYNNCQTDWYLESTAELGVQGEDCNDTFDPDYMDYSFNNTWSSQSTATNINNGSSTTVSLYHDASFDLANLSVIGSVAGDLCTNIGYINQECEGISFPWVISPTEPDIEDPCGTFGLVLDTDDLDNVTDAQISHLSYQLIRNKENDKAFQLLDCVNRQWANKLLVTSYLQQRDLDNATYYLNRLTTDTTEDLAYYEFYLLLIEGMSEGGTGKKQGDKEKIMEFTQQSQWPAFKTMSESAMAIYFDTRYNRSIQRGNNEQSLTESVTPLFSISPNPAQDYAIIDFTEAVDRDKVYVIRLYDMTSQLVMEWPIDFIAPNKRLSLIDLEAGIYFCSLVSKEEVLETQKLIVIQ